MENISLKIEQQESNKRYKQRIIEAVKSRDIEETISILKELNEELTGLVGKDNTGHFSEGAGINTLRRGLKKLFDKGGGIMTVYLGDGGLSRLNIIVEKRKGEEKVKVRLDENNSSQKVIKNWESLRKKWESLDNSLQEDKSIRYKQRIIEAVKSRDIEETISILKELNEELTGLVGKDNTGHFSEGAGINTLRRGLKKLFDKGGGIMTVYLGDGGLSRLNIIVEKRKGEEKVKVRLDENNSSQKVIKNWESLRKKWESLDNSLQEDKSIGKT